MMETDAGDFAINDNMAVAVTPKAPRAAGPQGPIFRVSPKLEVSSPSVLASRGPCDTVQYCTLQLRGKAGPARGADGTPSSRFLCSRVRPSRRSS